VSGKANGSDGRLVFRSKPRVSFVSRAVATPAFVGLRGDGRVKGSSSGSASTKVRERATGSTKDLPDRETARKDKPTSRERAKDLPTRERPKRGDAGIARRPPPKKRPPETKEPPPRPTPAPPRKPIEPPSAPPENVFGYEEPVRGCFEGQVFFIPESSRSLPKSYADLTSSAVLYACEWDIPTRAWQQGFPGLEDRFEWFAIRYSGAFRVEHGGAWTFRLASDDGSRLTIDDKVVIDNDGVHSPSERTRTIVLRPGDHTMVLEYFQGPRYHINLQLFSTPPGGTEGVFSVR
jgi:hypothetical protein